MSEGPSNFHYSMPADFLEMLRPIFIISSSSGDENGRRLCETSFPYMSTWATILTPASALESITNLSGGKSLS